MVDELTSLPSRKAFLKEVMSIKEGMDVILLLLDVDDFKFVNFSHGYSVGDSILKALALHLKKVLKTYFSKFSLARTGPNQFGVVIYDNVPFLRVEELFNRHFHLVEFRLRNDFVRLTLSCGVSRGREKFELLFAQAEDALYTSKKEGKNTITFYESSKVYDTEKFKEVRRKLIEAIKQKSIRPYFQPIVSLRTGRVYGYEVLSRIFYKDEVLRGDYVFYVADSLALTPEIDKILFINSIEFFGEYKLFFNVSMKYFFKELSNVLQVAKSYSLDLSNVVFEITESQKLLHEGAAVSIFKLIKEFKAKVAIDDFGAGYSNFMYLKRFPADVLKIDGAFVRGAKEDVKDLTIIKAIVEVAKAFRVRTLAEFIEDEETFRLMRDLGVSLGQGYFISRPEPEPAKVEIKL
ncbi:EAL domain-containing protein [Thermovibrio sp.]